MIKGLTRFALNLILWNDYLTGECIFGVGDAVVENANASHHLANLFHPISEVAWISNDTVCTCDLG